jgi:hypothetical protein
MVYYRLIMAKSHYQKGSRLLFPGKKLPGQKAGKHLKIEIKVSKTAQSKMLGLIFNLVFEK